MRAFEVSSIIKCNDQSLVNEKALVTKLLTDSRKLGEVSGTIFFAIPTKRNTGCNYVQALYKKGVRNFVLPVDNDKENSWWTSEFREANFWWVKNVVRELQAMAAFHRSQFDIPVVGITGSNGKTIVKDWIVQLIASDKRVVSSPKSYNSQIGVPLSVWMIDEADELAVFEAGISEAGEMESVKNVIKPTIGVFTNVGHSHDENFLSRYHKITEKLLLFTHCQTLIYCADHNDIHNAIAQTEVFKSVNRFTWGTADYNDVCLRYTKVEEYSTYLGVHFRDKDFELVIPFVDRASAENVMHCVSLLLYLGYDPEILCARAKGLVSVAMRMELNEGVNNSLLVNDGYSLDINSLNIALDFVHYEKQHSKKTLIMSDFLQSGVPEADLYAQVASLIRQRSISKFIGIGEALCRNASLFADFETYFYPSTEDFLSTHPFSNFQNETILIKGARVFHFEDIAKLLQYKSHETIMEVNLDAMVKNLNYYRSLIKPSTKLMAMVKAASYGAGTFEIANTLQYNNVDYLTVAYCDEGVELRRNGITLPIMVMNPESGSFEDIIKYDLEPDIYSFRILDVFMENVRLLSQHRKSIPVHIEFDTGMHRLGFMENDLPLLVEKLKKYNVLEVRSVFSHLACSDEPEMDAFTLGQIEKFNLLSTQLKHHLGKSDILCHILNSAGIIRFPDHQFDMVRLGIGLYGISSQSEVQDKLTPVSRLKTKISQIKSIPAGDSVGYGRRWVASRPSRIAILPIGYADGLTRHLGDCNGKVVIGDSLAPIIGSICMDMCFVDVTDIQCSETDEVVIFGDAHLLQQISSAAGTIPYEILTSVSPRVKRVYYQE